MSLIPENEDHDEEISSGADDAPMSPHPDYETPGTPTQAGDPGEPSTLVEAGTQTHKQSLPTRHHLASQPPIASQPPKVVARRSPRELPWRRYRVALILLGIMLLAAFFRFTGTNYDQNTHQHPDERFITSETLGLQWPSDLSQLTDVRHSPMNLRRIDGQYVNGRPYSYGSLPVYLDKLAGWALDTYGPIHPNNDLKYFEGYDGIAILGRILASIFDLITVLLVFLIARRLYSSTTGLVAAALVACAVTHIQIAHFYAADIFLVTFMMGALYFSVVLMQNPSWRPAIGAGLCLGWAVASKISVLPFALILVAAVCLRALYRKRTRILGAELGDPVGMRPANARERGLTGVRHFMGGLGLVALALAFAVVAFTISEPYVLWSFDWSLILTPVTPQFPGLFEAWFKSNPYGIAISEQAGIQSGMADVPYTRQYIGTVPILYHLQQMVFWGLGVVPGLIAVVGFGVALWRAILRKPAEILLMAGALPYLATILILETKWMRYWLPLVPIFCIVGAAFLMRGVAATRARMARQPWFGMSKRPIVVLQRNLFPILTAMAVGGAFLWAVAFMNIYWQEHSRNQASDWIYANVPSNIDENGQGRKVVLSHEAWDDTLPLGRPPDPARNLPARDMGLYGGSTEFGMYDDHPPADQEAQYIKERLQNTDYILIASNRLYGSIRHVPWRYQVQIKFYDLLFQNKLGFEHMCSNGTTDCQHTVQVTPSLLGINFDDQSADESFTVYDHPAVDVFKKTSNLTDDQWRILFSSALNEPADHFSTERHGKAVNDKSLAYDQPLSTLGETHDYAWNPLGQPDTQWIAVILWLLLAYVLGLLALPIVFTICRRLPDRGYAFAKLTGLLLLAWAIWCVSSAKLLPFTVWTTLFVMLLMAGLAYLCWRLGARELITEFVAKKRTLIIYYESLFILAFLVFLVIRMLNPDLWHPALGGEKTMEFGFLNATLRSPWMPPADPFFAGGYVNYYYYGQFVMAVMIKLLGIYPALGFNLAIPLLYALTFTAGASIVYNIVAWSQQHRGVRESGGQHSVSRSAMTFGVLAGVLMLAIGNMHGIYQLIIQLSPDFGRQLVGWIVRVFTGDARIEQAITSPPFPPQGFDFWGPSRIIHQTINEFPYWSFLFADFHPHLIDMPFTMLLTGLGMNLAFAGPFRRRKSAAMGSQHNTPTQSFILHVRDALSWLWGNGWSGALLFAVMAVVLGTLFATNSWDWPTFAGICGGAALIGLLIAMAKRSEVAQEERASVSNMFLVWGANVVAVGLLAGASLLAASPFLISFKNVLSLQIRALIDGARIQDAQDIMHRTTLAEFLFFWAIFVFVALSYTVVRLWVFPWRSAAGDVARLFTRSGSGAPRRSRGKPIFSPDAALTLKPGGPRSVGTLAMAGAGVGAARIPSSVAPMAFSSEVRESVEPSRERVAEGSEAVLDAPAPDGNGIEGAGMNKPSALSEANGVPGVATGELEPPAIISPTGETLEAEEAAYANDARWAVSSIETVPSDAETTYTVATAPEPYAEAAQWVAPRTEQPGVVPLWAGLGMLAITAALTGLQIATGQLLLALLVALLGGIIATTLSASRTPSAMFTGLLLVGALAVAMGVELVYLADHLRGGEMFRMNTVFKFYIQVWLLFGAGSAAAVYYILYGVRERSPAGAHAQEEATEEEEIQPDFEAAPDTLALADAEAEAPIMAQALAFDATPVEPVAGEMAIAENGHETPEVTEPVAHEEVPRESTETSFVTNTRLDNWLVWSQADADASVEAAEAPPASTGPDTVPLFPLAAPEPKQEYQGTGIPWNFARVAWVALFALFLAASGVFTIWGTQDRVGERFSTPPPVGTLDGLAFMDTAQYGVAGTDTSGGAQIEMKYDHAAINWMNKNIDGLHVIAEGPYEYYRDGGMRAASYTGLPMIVGGLHQGEQRYDWLVGNRDGESRQLLSTTDPQVALTILSKYDVDYIYLGQLEQLRARDGLIKFDQMEKAGVLKKVYSSKVPEEVRGTIIYQVVRSPKKLVGAPVAGSGVPGLSFTPIPTSTATPPPTPPVDDPQLKALMAAVAASPGDVPAHQDLVNWYRDHNFWQAAAGELAQMVKISPNDIAVRHQLGDAYQEMGQDEKALKAWEDARDVDPNNAAAHNKLGVAYHDRHRFDDAIKEFQAALKADQNFNEAALHLGETYLEKGDRQSARQAFQDAISKAKNKDDPWAIEAQKRLDEIK